MSLFPERTKEWFMARDPFLEAFFKMSREARFRRYAGEITHAEYCVIIEPFWKEYCQKIDGIWKNSLKS